MVTNLKTAHEEMTNPSHLQIEDALHQSGERDSFTILSRGDDQFIQVLPVSEDLFLLEYRAGTGQPLRRSDQDLSLLEIRSIFLAFATGDLSWSQAISWEVVEASPKNPVTQSQFKQRQWVFLLWLFLGFALIMGFILYSVRSEPAKMLFDVIMALLAVLLAVGLGLLIAPVVNNRAKRQQKIQEDLRANGISASAMILDVHTRYGAGADNAQDIPAEPVYSIHYRFETRQGKQIIHRGQISKIQLDKIKIGDKIQVLYDEINPGRHLILTGKGKVQPADYPAKNPIKPAVPQPLPRKTLLRKAAFFGACLSSILVSLDLIDLYLKNAEPVEVSAAWSWLPFSLAGAFIYWAIWSFIGLMIWDRIRPHTEQLAPLRKQPKNFVQVMPALPGKVIACPNCARYIRPGSYHCAYCGKNINWSFLRIGLSSVSLFLSLVWLSILFEKGVIEIVKGLPFVLYFTFLFWGGLSEWLFWRTLKKL